MAIGGISCESNTFSQAPPTLDDFRPRSYLVGDGIPRLCGDVRNALCGIVDAATAAGATLVPRLFASATPAGIVTRETFAHLREGLLSRLRTYKYGPWPLDSIVPALHSAMIYKDLDDAGELLRSVRNTVGPQTTLIAVLDFHANVSPTMVDAADLLLGNHTDPHGDTYVRGVAMVIVAGGFSYSDGPAAGVSSVGIEPEARRVLANNLSVHFRAAFEPIAADGIEVETPGLSASDLITFPYRRVRRPIAPLDREVGYLD